MSFYDDVVRDINLDIKRGALTDNLYKIIIEQPWAEDFINYIGGLDNEGLKERYWQGGYEEGYDAVQGDSYNSGYNDGNEDGYRSGYEAGYN
jgi:hypothetical protein